MTENNHHTNHILTVSHHDDTLFADLCTIRGCMDLAEVEVGLSDGSETGCYHCGGTIYLCGRHYNQFASEARRL